jgi:hypothetical protein
MRRGHEAPSTIATTPSSGDIRRRRIVAVVALGFVVVAASVVVLRSLDGGDEPLPLLAPRATANVVDPLAYEPGHDDELEREAAFGLAQPLYTKSPGGVVATARRTAAYRPLVEEETDGSGFDADLVEAIVFLESGGRPEVIAGDDPAGASGLTQILAETGSGFLGMKVDLAESRRLTARIRAAAERGDAAAVKRLRAERRRVDDRFDPRAALRGTVRYLTTARARLGRDDLAVVSYHMGIGNLTNVLRAYAGAGTDAAIPALVGTDELSWARIFFDTSPTEHAAAYRLLAALGDDSPTYYGRVLAAREIMRLWRDDPARLRELAVLHNAKASAEEVLHPQQETVWFTDGTQLEGAWRVHLLQRVPDDPTRLGFSVDATMGELAPRLGRPRDLYRGLRAEALAMLTYMAARVRATSGSTSPLQVTSTVRDESYQELLRARNVEATGGYSLHTTGFAFDIRRRYASPRQAAAFQHVLDALSARGLIAWVREPSAIHVTVSSAAEPLVDALLEPVS